MYVVLLYLDIHASVMPWICQRGSLRMYSTQLNLNLQVNTLKYSLPTNGAAKFAHDNSNMLMSGELIVGCNRDVIRLSLLQNQKKGIS